MSQQIRPSQYITTYGPGSVLEGPDGPRIVPTLGVLYGPNGSFAGQAVNFEIPEPRLAALLGQNAGIVRIPTNAELGWQETRELYSTGRFPTWSLCPEHGVLYQWRRGGAGSACPRCPRAPDNVQRDRASKQAVRFVVACRDGHLDDVDWHAVVTHTAPGCRPRYYRWEGGGAALRFVGIRCPACGGSTNLGIAYSRPWRCSGRFPERLIRLDDPSARPGCTVAAQMLQKGAANLRLPSLQAALTIPRLDTRLHLFLAQSNVRPVLIANRPANLADLLQMLDHLIAANMVPPAEKTAVQSIPWSQIDAAIQDVISPTLPSTYHELLNQEYQQLRNAAEFGAPSQASSSAHEPPCFEVIRSAVVSGIAGPNGVHFRVAPVSRLRVVLVQRGFRRIDDTGREIANDLQDGGANRVWYPGVELFGEGIFVEVDPHGPQGGVLPLGGTEKDAWHGAWMAGSPEIECDETHPVHVWWHTLAHRLMNSLAVDSGYSSASIRERIYVNIDRGSGAATGGILLYTVQPGGDGTLGGLISLTRSFASILRSALRDDVSCSNDPLCGEENFATDRVNGAACYACLLVSETSCEHRNRWLDRNLLVNNLP